MNACTGTATSTPANTLTVNADSAQYVINSGIFGLLMERLGKNWNGGIFVGTSSTIPNTNGMRNDVIDAFKEAGVGMIEWPGGCAAGSYNWSANKNPSNDVGTDRYMQLCPLLGIPPIIAGPGTSAAAANNLAWVTVHQQQRELTRTGRSTTSRSGTRSGGAAETRTRPPTRRTTSRTTTCCRRPSTGRSSTSSRAPT